MVVDELVVADGDILLSVVPIVDPVDIPVEPGDMVPGDVEPGDIVPGEAVPAPPLGVIWADAEPAIRAVVAMAIIVFMVILLWAHRAGQIGGLARSSMKRAEATGQCPTQPGYLR